MISVLLNYISLKEEGSETDIALNCKKKTKDAYEYHLIFSAEMLNVSSFA